MCNDHKNIEVEISNSLTTVSSAYQIISDKMHPRAMSIYVGHVDLYNNGKAVEGITYDVHEILANKVLLKICKEAQHRWGNDIVLYVGHTRGYIKAGGLCGIVAATGRNFKDAGDICAYIMSEMIKRVTIWKHEHYVDGTSTWLPGKHSLRKMQTETTSSLVG
jgi:molybdopterin synthase catalytic subunit